MIPVAFVAQREPQRTEQYSSIVLVALATTLVAHPQTARQITALGNAFSGSIRAALGK